MSQKQYFLKFRFADKFNRLPEQMELNARGHLCLTNTKIDMIPAGLKGVCFVFMAQKPRYIAPDFKGTVIYEDSNRFKDMDNLEVQAAQARYTFDRDIVEKPRYIEEEDGSLSLCSLPTDMHIFNKPFESGYFLDLTRTSVKEKQNLGGFKDIILYPKKAVQQEFSFVFPQKITRSKSRSVMSSKMKIYE